MKLKYLKILLIVFLTSKFGFAQVLTHKTEFDLGNDGSIEKLLFYDKFNGEFEKTEFTNFLVISGTDTLSSENEEVWVENPELNKFTDEIIDNRVGIIKDKGKYYLILTGFQYGCCRVKTTILEWNGNSLIEHFNEEFEVKETPIINNKRYLVGDFTFNQGYGNEDGDFHFYTFYPTEYRSFSDNFVVDKKLTQEKNLIHPRIEKFVDVYSAVLVNVTITDQTFLISKQFEQSLKDREFGVLSLIKLPDEYFQKFDKKELRIIRNEIFAYNGYDFNSPDLKKYFESKDWYKPTNKSSEEINNELTNIERHNIDKIRQIEKNGW